MKNPTINYWTVNDGTNLYLLPKTKGDISLLKEDVIKSRHKEAELRNLGLNIKYVRDVSLLDGGNLFDTAIRIQSLATLLIQNFDNSTLFNDTEELVTSKRIVNYHEYLWGIIFSFRNIEELAQKMADELTEISDFLAILPNTIIVKDVEELKRKMIEKATEPIV